MAEAELDVVNYTLTLVNVLLKVTERISPMSEWITDSFTWFYIATQNVWVIFVLAVWYKFGHIKLAKAEDEKPEFR